MLLTKSRIFLYFCLSFILGVALASFFFIFYLVSGIFLIGAIIIIIISWPACIDTPARSDAASSGEHSDAGGRKNWVWVVAGFCLIFLVLGVWRFQSRNIISENNVSRFNDKGKIAFAGVISQEPEIKMENQRIVVEVVKINRVGGIVDGKILITVPKYPRYEYGDELKIEGKLKAPSNFEDVSTGLRVDYKNYLAKDEIYSTIYYPQIEIIGRGKGNKIMNLLFKIKSLFEDKLKIIFHEPQASLADGLLLGEKATFPKTLTDNFSAVGITHIIALSGFNITIIAESLRRVFDKFLLPRQYSFWAIAAIIVGFVVMTGASASVVRAGVMGILIVLARRIGRLYNIRNALVLAAVLMVYFNPKILRFDLGFQLSFLATLGLVYLSPLLEKYFQWLPEKFDLRGIGMATISAQVAVLPLLLFSFGKLSLIAPVANLLVLPIVPLSMLIIFISALIGFAWIKLGVLAGWLAWLLLSYQIKIAEILSKIPFASWNVKINWLVLFAMYAILLLAASKLYQIKKAEFH